MPMASRISRIAVAVLAFSALAAGAGSIVVNPRDDRGLWEGWGSSLCWWGNAIGGSRYEELHADLMFTTGTVAYAGQELPGLGLNILRYNIGGSGRGAESGEVVSPKIPWFRQIDGFWPEAGAAGWDWSRDGRQRRLLLAACRRGVDRVEFFANAPMWWMTDSRSSAGGRLRPEDEQNFAHYLAAVVAQAQDNWGIAVASIEPFNEPQAEWWVYPKDQEGCHIPKPQQAAILGHLRHELDALKLQQVRMATADENTVTAAREGYEFLKRQGVAELVGQVNVHGYDGLKPWRDNHARAALRQSVGDKRLWMSEYGDGDPTGQALARTILDDLNWLRPTAWIYWQVVEPRGPWGLVNANYRRSPDDDERGRPQRIYTKYYAFAHFTRFLRPGCHLLGSGDPNSVVGYDAGRRQLAIVTLCETPQRLEYDLSAMATAGRIAEVTCTHLDGSVCFSTAEIPVQDKKFAIDAPAPALYSVVVQESVP